MTHTQGVSVPKTFNLPDLDEPTTHDVLRTLLEEYAQERPQYREMWEGFRAAAEEYKKRRGNIDTAYAENRGVTELGAIRALTRVKEMAFQEFDTVFMRSACKLVKLASSAALAK